MVATQWPRLDANGLGYLDLWLQAHPKARLIILDTFAKIRGQTRSATLYGDDYASLEQVQALAHRHNVAVLVIHHTGKESREDPLDEVNATQGLNGVADNILILRRERGKKEATLIGDGRELVDVEQTLAFDLAAGGWRLTEAPPADQPKTPERAEILDLLKASPEPMSPKQIRDVLGKPPSTVSTLLARMVRDGDIKMTGCAKYIPVETVETVESGDSSPLKKGKEKDGDTLFDAQEDSSSSKHSIVSTGVGENEPEQVEEPTAPPPPAGPPSLDTLHWVSMVAQITHSRLAEPSATPIPDNLPPDPPLPSKAKLWPVAGDCTGVFCQGECVCGEHVCDPCGCEAGALIDNHPWYYDRREVRRGLRCEYCYCSVP